MVKAFSRGNITVYQRRDKSGAYENVCIQSRKDSKEVRAFGGVNKVRFSHRFASRREAIAFVGGYFGI